MSSQRDHTITQQDLDEDLEQVHQKGFIIAKKHITPYLCDLEAKHGFRKTEIAAALIILAYSAIREMADLALQDGRKEAFSMFGKLCNKTIALIEKRKSETMQ